MRLIVPDAVRKGVRGIRAAGVAGLLFGLLFTAALLLLRQGPAIGGSDAQVASWFDSSAHRTAVDVGLYLVPVAAICFLWFLAAVRYRIGEREDRFLSTVFLGSGLIFLGVFLVAGAVLGAVAASMSFLSGKAPDATLYSTFRGLGYGLLAVDASRLAGVFMITTSTVGRRTGALPLPLCLLGYACALVLLFIVSAYEVVLLIFPAWVAVVSLEILRGTRLRSLLARGLVHEAEEPQP